MTQAADRTIAPNIPCGDMFNSEEDPPRRVLFIDLSRGNAPLGVSSE